MRRSLWRGLGLAAVVGLAGCYSASSEARVPTKLENATTAQLIGTAGQPLPEPLRVRVLDQEDDPVGGIVVLWQATTGGGRVQSSTSTTNDQGIAEMTFILGRTAGRQGAQAAVTGLQGSPVTFAAEALPPGGGGGGGGVP